MLDRRAYEDALLTHAPSGWDENDIGIAADDLEGDWDHLGSALIAHSLWRMGVTPEHDGECRAGEDFSIYVNECAPCQTRLLALAAKVLADMTHEPFDPESVS
jgi:hypothetical protein